MQIYACLCKIFCISFFNFQLIYLDEFHHLLSKYLVADFERAFLALPHITTNYLPMYCCTVPTQKYDYTNLV